jgi:hypothetical protein
MSLFLIKLKTIWLSDILQKIQKTKLLKKDFSKWLFILFVLFKKKKEEITNSKTVSFLKNIIRKRNDQFYGSVLLRNEQFQTLFINFYDFDTSIFLISFIKSIDIFLFFNDILRDFNGETLFTYLFPVLFFLFILIPFHWSRSVLFCIFIFNLTSN